MDRYALPDGRVVTIRPIRPDDGERLHDAYSRLSPGAQYRRFLIAKPELSPADVRYLTRVDGRNHHALVATDGGEIVAVARFVRPLADSRVAEFAIVVGDPYQGAGLGRRLMQRLAHDATERGIERFHATMLADNLAIRALIKGLAAGPITWHADGPTVEAEFALAASGHAQAA